MLLDLKQSLPMELCYEAKLEEGGCQSNKDGVLVRRWPDEDTLGEGHGKREAEAGAMGLKTNVSLGSKGHTTPLTKDCGVYGFSSTASLPRKPARTQSKAHEWGPSLGISKALPTISLWE
jgi:hypothetical protein